MQEKGGARHWLHEAAPEMMLLDSHRSTGGEFAATQKQCLGGSQ